MTLLSTIGLGLSVCDLNAFTAASIACSGGGGRGSLLQFVCKQSTYIIMPVLVTTSDPDITSLCRGYTGIVLYIYI